MKTTDPILNELLHKKRVLLAPLFLIISFFTNKLTVDKFVDGPQFVLSFLSILPIVYINISVLYFVLQSLLRNPNRLNVSLKYLYYVLIIIFSFAPFLYLWGMSDVIKGLKW